MWDTIIFSSSSTIITSLPAVRPRLPRGRAGGWPHVPRPPRQPAPAPLPRPGPLPRSRRGRQPRPRGRRGGGAGGAARARAAGPRHQQQQLPLHGVRAEVPLLKPIRRSGRQRTASADTFLSFMSFVGAVPAAAAAPLNLHKYEIKTSEPFYLN